MTLIIIEGVDGAGKTTLMRNMGSLLPDVQYVHSGVLRTHPLKAYVEPLINYTYRDSIICDRWHVGEDIYGPLFRGQSRMYPGLNTYIEQFLTARGALRIMLSPPVTEVQRRVGERGDHMVSHGLIRPIHEAFYAYGRKHSGRWATVASPNASSMVHLAKSRVGAHDYGMTFVGDPEVRPSAIFYTDQLPTAPSHPLTKAFMICDKFQVENPCVVGEYAGLKKLVRRYPGVPVLNMTRHPIHETMKGLNAVTDMKEIIADVYRR